MHQQFSDVEAREPLLSGEKRQWQSQTRHGDDWKQPSPMECFPMPSWTWAKTNSKGRILPQTIAHRGYKAEHPENTLKAFEGAVEVGTHAIETDIHLSKDDVVVLSHDGDLKRCFGKTDKVIDCDWEYLSTLRTLKAPHEPMPRLLDLLEYIAQPGLEHIWLLLDIKIDNNSDDVMRLIAKTLASVPPGQRPWNQRVVLGIWTAKYLSLCTEYLPGYPISHIGFSTCYARQFLKVPNVSFNILQKALFGPIGSRFMRDVKKAKRPLFVWTVNEVNLMKWSIQKHVDGVITDDPKTFKQICDGWDDEQEPLARVSWSQWLYTFWIWFIVTVLSIPFRTKYPETAVQFIKKNELKEKASIKIGQL